MSSIARIGTLALGTAIAINVCVVARGQTCTSGSSPTVLRVSNLIGPAYPSWQNLSLDVPKFDALPGQVLVQADITVSVSMDATCRAENLSTTGPCPLNWCVGNDVTVNVPVPMQPALTLHPLECGTDSLTVYDGILDFSGDSGGTHNYRDVLEQVSLSVTDPDVLANTFSGSGAVEFLISAFDVSYHSAGFNLVSLLADSDTITVTIAYGYCSPGFDFCVPGQLGVLACPCGNPQQPNGSIKGCDNSAGTGGAVLHSGGAASLAADSVQFTATGETPNATTIFLQGTASISGGAVFGQGVRCTDGALLRLYVKSASNGTSSAPTGSDSRVSARSMALGDSIVAGTPRFYSAYYRDSTVLGGCPSTSTFNTTQGQSVTWVP